MPITPDEFLTFAIENLFDVPRSDAQGIMETLDEDRRIRILEDMRELLDKATTRS